MRDKKGLGWRTSPWGLTAGNEQAGPLEGISERNEVYSVSKSPSNSRVPSYRRKEMGVIPGGRNEKLEHSGFPRVTPGDWECRVPLLPATPHFCISHSVKSSAWPQLRISECELSSKAGQHPELYKDENEDREPRSVGFEEDTTHTMFSNLG